MALRPHVTCPVCGAVRVPCRPSASGYVLMRHSKPAVGYWRVDHCTATSHPVTADAVLAWAAEEQRYADERVATAEHAVTVAQERLAKMQSEARETRAQLEKIAAKARKVVV